MNKKANDLLILIVSLLIIGITFYFLFSITDMIISKIEYLNANIIVAILAGSFTIIGFFITRYLEKKKSIEQQIREQKLPIYEEFIDFIFKVFENTNADSKDKVSEEEMKKFFWKLNKKSILWLSDNTLKSYIIWRNSIEEITETNQDTIEKSAKLLLDFEKLLFDFRKDIGHKNADIKKGDILSMFINDWRHISK